MGIELFVDQRNLDEVNRDRDRRHRQLRDRMDYLESQEAPAATTWSQALAYASASNTVAAQTVLSKTVVGGSMGANGHFRADFSQLLNNVTGSTQAILYELLFGGGVIWAVSASITSGATKSLLYFNVTAGNLNSQSSQLWHIVSRMSDTIAINTLAGIALDEQGYTTTAINTATDKAFQIRITMPVADVNLSWELFGGKYVLPLAV